jgi:hypothetical protein
MWITRDQMIPVIKIYNTYPGSKKDLQQREVLYSMNSELTESSLLILNIVSANKLATLNC